MLDWHARQAASGHDIDEMMRQDVSKRRLAQGYSLAQVSADSRLSRSPLIRRSLAQLKARRSSKTQGIDEMMEEAGINLEGTGLAQFKKQ